MVLLVGQRLAGRDHYAVPGVDAHRVYVFHVADRDAVVRAVAHHLVLDFLPADQRLLDQHLVYRAGRESAVHYLVELLPVVGDASSRAAQCVSRPDDHRQPDLIQRVVSVFHGFDDGGRRHWLAYLHKKALEQFAVFRVPDGFKRRAQKTDVVSLQNARVRQFDSQIQAGLSSERGEHAVRSLLRDDSLQHLDGQRLDVNDVRDVLVGHDRGGVGVHEDRGHALFPEGLARLRSGVVELSRLPDYYGARSDHKDLAGSGT